MPPYAVENGEAGGRRQFWTALAFLFAAFLLLLLPAGVQQQVAGAIRATLLRPFVAVQEGLGRAQLRTLEIDALRLQLDSVTAILARQTTLADENRQLRGLMEMGGKEGVTLRAAGVLRPGTAGSESMFMLDVGSRDGVVPSAPVLNADGLVGVVREVGRGFALGMDWTHPDFRASAMTADGEVYGIVEPHRGRFREEDRLVFNGTAFHETVEPGTPVVTSGLGGVYPRGIPLGTVQGVAEAEAGWRRSYWLLPAVIPASVTHAQVVLATASGSEAEGLGLLWEGRSGEAHPEVLPPAPSPEGTEDQGGREGEPAAEPDDPGNEAEVRAPGGEG